jgi:plastocyanin
VLLVGALALLPFHGIAAQSVADRTPNLSGGWTGTPGTVYFNFLHRFEHGPAPTHKVTNFPTFLLGYTPVRSLLLAANYGTNSDLVAGYPNEWEIFARWATPALGPAHVALTGAYDNASQSVDGEAQVRLGMGKAALLGVARAFSSGYGADGRVALGGGAVLPLGGTFALAGDVITLLDRSDAEKVAWSAGLQIRIPYTPHSLSLQATNTNTATLEGSSRGGDKTRYGFEFTIPVTLSRYLHRGGGAAGGQAVVATNADSVVVTIRDFEFSPAQVTIRPGATVVFVNAGQVAHTATADDNSWDTGMIQPGQRVRHTFSAGQSAYHCTPHPFMKGTVVVSGGEQ